METLLWIILFTAFGAFWNTIQLGKQNRAIQDYLEEKLGKPSSTAMEEDISE